MKEKDWKTGKCVLKIGIILLLNLSFLTGCGEEQVDKNAVYGGGGDSNAELKATNNTVQKSLKEAGTYTVVDVRELVRYEYSGGGQYSLWADEIRTVILVLENDNNGERVYFEESFSKKQETEHLVLASLIEGDKIEYTEKNELKLIRN